MNLTLTHELSESEKKLVIFLLYSSLIEEDLTDEKLEKLIRKKPIWIKSHFTPIIFKDSEKPIYLLKEICNWYNLNKIESVIKNNNLYIKLSL